MTNYEEKLLAVFIIGIVLFGLGSCVLDTAVKLNLATM